MSDPTKDGAVCKAHVSYGGGCWHSRPCGRVATRGEFCGVHDPERPDKVARRALAKKRFDARIEAAMAPAEVERLRATLDKAKAALGEVDETITVFGDMEGARITDIIATLVKARRIAARALAELEGK